MQIDIKPVLELMKQSLLVSLGELVPGVKEAVTGYIDSAQERLGNLASGAISGELSWKFCTERLKEETVNIKDQVLSITQIAGAQLQTIPDRIVTIFENFLKDKLFSA